MFPSTFPRKSGWPVGGSHHHVGSWGATPGLPPGGDSADPCYFGS